MNKTLAITVIALVVIVMVVRIFSPAMAADGVIKDRYTPMNTDQQKGVGIIDVVRDTYVFRTPDDSHGAELDVDQSVSFNIDESSLIP
jgi:hypothetical protein